MNWPAGVVARMNAALSAYNAIKAMYGASDLAKWANENKELFDIATAVEKLRRQRKEADQK